MVVDGQSKTVDHQLEEKSAVPAAAALDKMLVMLGELSERMCRMESSQFEQVDRQRKDSIKSSVLASALGAGRVLASRFWSVLLLFKGHRMSRRPPALVPDDQLLLKT